jgi:hypothetical protein
MPEDAPTKVCPLCAETIKAAARVCPYCRKSQKRFLFINRFDVLAIVTGLVFIATIGLIVDYFDNGRSFSSSRNKIAVLNSQLAVARNVVMTGVLTNKSEFAWRNFEFEVRYLDGSGKLVDVDTGSDDFVVLSHGDHSFHLNFSPRRTIPEHASYQVTVRSASAPGRWFSGD